MTYNEFIESILSTRGRFECGNEYHERHHILPKCMGGTNEENNLIDLYAREHFEAHHLLAEEHPNEKKLVYAWWKMCNPLKSFDGKYTPTSEEYEKARVCWRANCQGENNPNYGNSMSEVGKQHLREIHSGKKLSMETRQKMSLSSRGSNSSTAKSVVCDGVIYDTICDCASHYQIKENTMAGWLSKRTSMPQEFIDKNLRYFGDNETIYYPPKNFQNGNNPRAKSVYYDGVIYSTMKECYEAIGIDKATLRKYLNNINKAPLVYKEKGLCFV